jgi:multidrug efflux system outer membrane protein
LPGAAGLRAAAGRLPHSGAGSACATLAVAPAWRTQAPAVGPGAAVERQWWQAFGDPALDRLVVQALQNNGDLRTARSRLQEYQARIRVAASAQQPSLTSGSRRSAAA